MKTPRLDKNLVTGLLIMALAEDLGSGDITGDSIIPDEARFSAKLTGKADGVICGMRIMPWLFGLLDENIRFKPFKTDGAKVSAGTVLGNISGPASQILAGERLALNILQHLSGVASLTAKYVETVKGTGAKILDTRKTLPGLRVLEKYAVVCGGGHNHRMGLYDAVMIKDNHIAVGVEYGHNITDLVRDARKQVGRKTDITVEVTNIIQLREALNTDADIIMLDNMKPRTMRSAVEIVKNLNKKRLPKLEASGGVNLRSVRRIAETGVDRISIGALTHSAPALDISMDVVKITK